MLRRTTKGMEGSKCGSVGSRMHPMCLASSRITRRDRAYAP
jgi:hypothetical protein